MELVNLVVQTERNQNQILSDKIIGLCKSSKILAIIVIQDKNTALHAHTSKILKI